MPESVHVGLTPRRSPRHLVALAAVAAATAAVSAAATAAATSIPATPAAATATAAATSIPAAATAAAAFARPGLIHGQRPAAELLAVECFDRGGRFLVVLHFDEPEAPRPAGLPVGDHLRSRHLPVFRE